MLIYAAFGGTQQYLQLIDESQSVESNIKNSFLNTVGYLYGETLFLLKQEVQEVGVYNAVIECKWRNEPMEMSVLDSLKIKAYAMVGHRGRTWYMLFSKSGFSKALADLAQNDDTVILIDIAILESPYLKDY